MSFPLLLSRVAAPLFATALGAFALTAQTLLFRDFLSVFQGNELAIGLFFAAWLLWIVIGSSASRFRLFAHDSFLSHHYPLLALLYLPAFVLQEVLILHLRRWGGVASYEEFPFLRMIAFLFVANAPVSFCTGLLFPLACRWFSTQSEPSQRPFGIARLYRWEVFGSALGGIGTTLFLTFGFPPHRPLFLAAIFLIASVSLVYRPLPLRTFGNILAGMLVLVAIGMLTQADRYFEQRLDRFAWETLLRREEYRESFSTPQARYHIGVRENQSVVLAFGMTCETLPADAATMEVLAAILAQKPDPRRILLVGPGALALATALLLLPSVESITWLHPDPDFPSALLSRLPSSLVPRDRRLSLPSQDIRIFLRQTRLLFDLILVTTSEAATLSLARYSTREFYALLRQRLAPGGVVGRRILGGENVLSEEHAWLGATTRATLGAVFSTVVLKPGASSWFLASNDAPLTTDVETLRQRFSSHPFLEQIAPPTILSSLYPPDRIAFQMRRYDEGASLLPFALRIEEDRFPHSTFYSCLLALRRMGLSSAASFPRLGERGYLVAILPLVLYALFRMIYLLRSPPGLSSRLTDSAILLVGMGAVGMASNIIWLFLYQSRFGAIFLHMGLLSSLFLIGSAVGTRIGESWSASPGPREGPLLGILLLHLFLVALLLHFSTGIPQSYHIAFFLLCGVFSGIYIPGVAYRFLSCGFSSTSAGRWIECLDPLGGALGAVLGSMLLLLFGVEGGLLSIGVAIAIHLPGAIFSRDPLPLQGDFFWKIRRPVAYVLTYGAVLLLAMHHLFPLLEPSPPKDLPSFPLSSSAATSSSWQPASPIEKAAQTLVKERSLLPTSVRTQEGDFVFFEVRDAKGERIGYVFPTEPLVKGVKGYRGPLSLLVYVKEDGVLVDFRILSSREDKAYLDLLTSWYSTLRGKNLFQKEELEAVDTVTGATYSAEAIVETLRRAGQAFQAILSARSSVPTPAGTSSSVLSSSTRGTTKEAERSPLALPDRGFLLLSLSFLLAFFLRRFLRYSDATAARNRWVRRGVLVATLLGMGFLLNLQYATPHILRLLALDVPSVSLTAPFFLVFLVPCFTLLVGNLWCGYLCPFGAFQELLGDLVPFKLDRSSMSWRMGRAIKYLLLFFLVVLFVFRGISVPEGDLLIFVFAGGWGEWSWGKKILLVGMLGLAFFYRRFWCRALCPTGAFLALLQGVGLWRRWMPLPWIGCCDLGIHDREEYDCIHCDRCRMRGRQEEGEERTTPRFPRTLRDKVDVSFLFSNLSKGVGSPTCSLSRGKVVVSVMAPPVFPTSRLRSFGYDERCQRIVRGSLRKLALTRCEWRI